MTEELAKLVILDTGREITAFDRYTIKTSMFDVGNPFTFSLWGNDEPGGDWRTLLREVKLGQKVMLTIDDAPQLTGRIETLNINVDRSGGRVLVVSGRDLAGPAIDWDADPRTSVRGMVLEQALVVLFEPLGIDVAMDTSADFARQIATGSAPGGRGRSRRTQRRRQLVAAGRPDKGMTVMAFVKKLIERLGFMLWVAPDTEGNLAIVVDVPAYGQLPTFKFERRFVDAARTTLTETSNILDSQYRAQIRNIPTQVSAYGRATRGDNLPSRTRTRHKQRSIVGAGEPEEFRLYTNLTSNTVPELVQEINRRNHRTARNSLRPAVSEANTSANTTDASSPREARAVRTVFSNDDLARWPFVVSPLPPQPRHLHDKRAVDPRTGEQAARRVMSKAMKDFRSYEITVQGHGQDIPTIGGGPTKHLLYAINTIAYVYDGATIVDEEMLITDVEMSGSRTTGRRTKLTLGTLGAIDLTPETT